MEELGSDADASLVLQAKGGDRRAFAELIRRHEPLLRRTVVAVTRHAADADDVLQESVLKIWMHLHTLEDAARLRAWMARIASREALRFVAARRRESELTGERAVVPGADHLLDRVEVQHRIRAALAMLPARQARSWVLREVDGCSYREIAERLEITESAVRGLIAAARRSLPGLMADGAVGTPRPPGAPGTAAPASTGAAPRAASISARRPPARRTRPVVRVHLDPVTGPVPDVDPAEIAGTSGSTAPARAARRLDQCEGFRI